MQPVDAGEPPGPAQGRPVDLRALELLGIEPSWFPHIGACLHCSAAGGIPCLPMRIEAIDHPGDPRVADYRDMRDPALRLARGLFVAESRAVVRELLASTRFRTRSLLLTPPALESLREVLEAVDDSVPVYLASNQSARALVGFDFHRGCAALGERGAPLAIEPLLCTARPPPRRPRSTRSPIPTTWAGCSGTRGLSASTPSSYRRAPPTRCTERPSASPWAPRW